MGGGWGGHSAASIAGGAAWAHGQDIWLPGTVAVWRPGMRAGNWNRFHHGHFVHRHGRVFFVGGPWWGGYGYYDNGCWQWIPTRWGLQRIWVCGSYY